MFIEKIILKDFRNYKDLDIDFHEKVNIFLGNNAQGKTNLLEAIYITSLGKSFRTSKDDEMISFDEEYCKVKTIANKPDERNEIEIVLSKGGKAIKVDGIKAKNSSALLEKIYIVSFTPEDLKIVKEEPEKRRKFLDRELCLLKPAYYNCLSNYKKTLLQRNTLLKEERINLEMLDVWNEKLAEYGSEIIIKRKEFIEKINIISQEIHNSISAGKENLTLSYEPSIEVKETRKEQADLFYSVLKKSEQNDIFKRNTSKGPHRDDLSISVNGIDIRHFGSQGQQRTAALSLKLAEIKLIKEETGEDAILLLDDVLSELDRERQGYLIKSFEGIQLFITTTELSKELKDSLPKGNTYYVEKGTVVKDNNI